MKSVSLPENTADCTHYFVRMYVTASFETANSEMQICKINFRKPILCNFLKSHFIVFSVSLLSLTLSLIRCISVILYICAVYGKSVLVRLEKRAMQCQNPWNIRPATVKVRKLPLMCESILNTINTSEHNS